MDNATFTTLTRQAGLLREMQVVANNIANAATTGFRAEGVIFSEFVRALEDTGGSLSMARAGARVTDQGPGALRQTNGTLDLAIEGAGFFRIDTPDGPRLTRAGRFQRNTDGEVVTSTGDRLIDAGGAPVLAPAEARSIAIASDGTLTADGQPLAQIGLFLPADPARMTREDGVRFRVEGEMLPVDDPVIQQGFLETSNVEPVTQIARMIEVQRSYELGQGFLDQEDERIRTTLRTLGN